MTEGGLPFSTPADISDLDYTCDLGDPGEYPFTRGQRGSRSSSAKWVHRELYGEGSPATSNRQLRYLLEHGAQGLDVIGDAPTVGVMDPDHPYAKYSVGTQGVSICRAQDFLDLYDGVPLDKVSVSHSLPPSFAIAGLYLAATRMGFDPKLLRGSVINAPCFGEDYAYATMMPYPLRMRLALDAIEFATQQMPKFHPFVEDNYFISDGGPGPVDEMALGFIEIREVVKALLDRGLDIDSFAPRIAVLVNCRMELFQEIAKIRATRRIFARMMLPARSGSIINVSSIHGTAGMPTLAAYSASKGGVEALTRTLALEWATKGVRVNAVCPGYFTTDMNQGLREHEHYYERMLSRIPQKRFGEPSELVPAFVFLASDASSYMTGAMLHIDGGWTAT